MREKLIAALKPFADRYQRLRDDAYMRQVMNPIFLRDCQRAAETLAELRAMEGEFEAALAKLKSKYVGLTPPEEVIARAAFEAGRLSHKQGDKMTQLLALLLSIAAACRKLMFWRRG